MEVRNYQDLIVWQRAMELVEEVYCLTKLLPKEERYALTDQMRRAVVSIPSNIAEGQSRNATKDFVRFLYIAMGSKSELETQLLICIRLHYLQEKQITNALTLCGEVGRMLHGLVSSLISG